jgi:hypothetical protein
MMSLYPPLSPDEMVSTREVIAGDGFDVLSELEPGKAAISSTLESIEGPYG